jgi:hypothetical protein
MLFKGLKEMNSWPRGFHEYGDWFMTHKISGAKNDQVWHITAYSDSASMFQMLKATDLYFV